MCFVDLDKALYIVPMTVFEWSMAKKAISEAFIRSVVSLYEEAKTRDRVDSELTEEFEVKVVMYRICAVSIFAVVLDCMIK